jgi:hypothetical protein
VSEPTLPAAEASDWPRRLCCGGGRARREGREGREVGAPPLQIAPRRLQPRMSAPCIAAERGEAHASQPARAQGRRVWRDLEGALRQLCARKVRAAQARLGKAAVLPRAPRGLSARRRGGRDVCGAETFAAQGLHRASEQKTKTNCPDGGTWAAPAPAPAAGGAAGRRGTLRFMSERSRPSRRAPARLTYPDGPASESQPRALRGARHFGKLRDLRVARARAGARVRTQRRGAGADAAAP